MPQTEYRGNKYISLLRELRSLGIGDVFFRVNYELSKRLGLVARKHPAGKLSAGDVIRSLDLENPALADVRRAYDSQDMDRAVAELIKYFKSRESPRFCFNWQDRDHYQKLLREQFADQKAQLVEQADRVCQNHFEIFGSNPVEFGDEVNWHLDLSTGSNWPLKHWSKIDIRDLGRTGDARVTWEINRHQCFFTLGRAYWFTADEKYARKFASLMKGWLDANPPEMGVNWYSNLEIAMRLISWIWAYHYFLDSPCFGDGLHFDFLRTVLQSCRHITRDFQYSLRSMKNNHVVGDAAALVFAGIMFPEFRELKQWRRTYIDILYRELDKQVYDDGTDYEQAINYHRFVLYFYLLLFKIMQINDYNIPAKFPQKLEKMIEFMMYVMKPDGTMPRIGDSDDADVLALSNSKPCDLTSILSTGAVMFGRGDFKNAAGKLSEETLWLCGEEGVQAFSSLKGSTPSSLSRGFPEGGYYIMRTGWELDAKYLLFKCGPHADHGHADALHIEMYYGGKDRLRDCGTYAYSGPREWRNFFRSTRAHNTVVVDGESQSVPLSVFRWLRAAKPKTLSWATSSGFDYVDAEHDGYTRFAEPVIHQRSVFFVKPEYWVIVDRLTGSGRHSVELLFHTPCGEHELDQNSKVFRSQGFAIIPVVPDDLDANVYECIEEPIQGWFSPCYGIKETSTNLVYSFASELPKVMVTILDTGCRILDTGCSMLDAGILSIELDNFKDTLLLNGDAEVAYLREDKAAGKIIHLAMVAGSYIRFDGKTLLETKTPVRSVDVTISEAGEIEIDMDPEMELRLEL